VKITNVETFIAGLDRRNYLFVRVQTDEGIHGIGEAYSCGPDDATAAVVADFETWLIGKDPRDVEALWHLMYAGSRFPGGSILNSALSGIEHALWDILGKSLGVPVWRLLGGQFRDKIRVYQSPRGATPEELAEDAARLIERYGYTALKISPQPPGYAQMPFGAVVRESAKRLEAVRNAVGPDVEIGVDAHARIFEPVRAVEMADALKPYRPFFFEEALRPENIDAMADVRARSSIPIATGEMLYTKFQFRELLEKRGTDIIQPDVCIAGGLLELKKIAAMAEAHYVTVAPHNPMGPVATAVNVHFAVSTPNFLILEYSPDDVGKRRDLLLEPLKVTNGHIEVPRAPGFGIELNLDAIQGFPPNRWHRPFPTNTDGSLAFQ
jgi:galactonate dehydratase